MSSGRPPPQQSVPTLTEVISWPAATPAAAPNSAPAARQAHAFERLATQTQTVPAAARMPNEAELTQRVLHEVQRQVDLMLEVRLREALAPLLTRAADALVRDARNELAATLHDVVTRAVAEQLTRRRDA